MSTEYVLQLLLAGLPLSAMFNRTHLSLLKRIVCIALIDLCIVSAILFAERFL